MLVHIQTAVDATFAEATVLELWPAAVRVQFTCLDMQIPLPDSPSSCPSFRGYLVTLAGLTNRRHAMKTSRPSGRMWKIAPWLLLLPVSHRATLSVCWKGRYVLGQVAPLGQASIRIELYGRGCSASSSQRTQATWRASSCVKLEHDWCYSTCGTPICQAIGRCALCSSTLLHSWNNIHSSSGLCTLSSPVCALVAKRPESFRCAGAGRVATCAAVPGSRMARRGDF